jgi:hypothetical protein
MAVNRNVGGSNPPRRAKIFVLNKLQSLGRAFGCEPNGPCTDCCIPTLLRFLCHKNVTHIVEGRTATHSKAQAGNATTISWERVKFSGSDASNYLDRKSNRYNYIQKLATKADPLYIRFAGGFPGIVRRLQRSCKSSSRSFLGNRSGNQPLG